MPTVYSPVKARQQAQAHAAQQANAHARHHVGESHGINFTFTTGVPLSNANPTNGNWSNERY